MADFTFTVPGDIRPGDMPIVQLPDDGQTYIPPAGWNLRGRTLWTRWGPQDEPGTFTAKVAPAALCGLCGDPIAAAHLTISRLGILAYTASVPDAHEACYTAAVAAKVTRRNGGIEVPGRPTPPNTPKG